MSHATGYRQHTIIFLAFSMLCCIMAIYGYFIAPPGKPRNPPDVQFMTNGGSVLFPHHHHSSEDGGAFACSECHHTYDPAAKDSSEMKCRTCHYNNPDVVETVCADDAAHPRCIGRRCMTCHEGEDCFFCHRIGR